MVLVQSKYLQQALSAAVFALCHRKESITETVQE